MSSFKLGIIVTAYHKPAQLAGMLSLLRDPRVVVYLHIDRKSSIEQFQRALQEVQTPEIVWIPRFRSRWGDIGMVDAVLTGAEHALADGCGYLMLVSGQDLPLQPISQIVEFASDSGSTSYMEHFPLPADRWSYQGRDRINFYTYTVPFLDRRETAIPRSEDASAFSMKGKALNTALRLRTIGKPERRFPDYVRPFGGWTWWNLSRPAAQYVLDFVAAHPDYRLYHRHTFIAEEVFIPSIIGSADRAEIGPVMSDSLRFVVGDNHFRHPPVLSTAELPQMLAGNDLFARKFDATVDSEVIAELRNQTLA